MSTALSQKRIDLYFSIWVFFIPITSVLVIPSIQGTLPAYFFAFLSILVVLLTKQRVTQWRTYFTRLSVILFVYLFLAIISQALNSFTNNPAFVGILLVDNFDATTTVFRSTFFTQSLYLFAGILTFLFVRNYYNASWDKSIFRAAVVFAVFGLYEFAYFLIFREYGDFLTNRTFGEHDTINLGNQLMTIGSLTFQRVNGLALEPSMFAFTLLPFWIYSLFVGRKFISMILFVALFDPLVHNAREYSVRFT